MVPCALAGLAIELGLAWRFDFSVKSRSHSNAVVNTILSVKRQRQLSVRPTRYVHPSPGAEAKKIL